MKYYQLSKNPLDLAYDMTSRVCMFDPKDQLVLSPKMDAMIRKRSNQFSDAVDKKVHDNQRDAGKSDPDNFWGKVGEYICSFFMYKKAGFPSVMPDTEIYSDYQKKMYEHDLPFGQVDSRYPDCGVKTCTSGTIEMIGEMSWTFQFCNKNGRGGRDKLFDKPQSPEPILLACVDPGLTKDTRVVASVPWNQMFPLLGEMRFPRYKKTKRALYFNDLVELNDLYTVTVI